MAPGADDAGVVPSLSADDLIATVPELEAIADLSARTLISVPGANLTPDDIFAVVDEIASDINRGAAGIVVVQGTDTMEETAFLLDLLLDVDVPVVVTGAMRNPSLPGADGPANLVAAARVATSASTRGLDVVVVMNDEVHAARFVQKRHTSSLSAFCSPGLGPLGAVIEDRVTIALRPRSRSTIRLEHRQFAPVALVGSALGDDGRLLERVADLGYEGVVIEAFGGGHVSMRVASILEDLAGSVPVVLCSRTGSGEVLRQTYGFKGSEMDLLSRGLVSGGWLTGIKARLLLGLLIGDSDGTDVVVERWDAWLHRVES